MAWNKPPAIEKPAPSGPTLFSFLPSEQYPSLGGPVPAASGNARGNAAAASQDVWEGPTISQNKPADTFPNGDIGYYVTGSKKGGFPVAVEKRGCGKKVTVIRNIVGDPAALLQGLKRKMGSGGVVNPDGSVEIQGERQPEVEKFLTEMKCLKSVSGAKKAAAAPVKAAAKAALPTKIDKKMAQAANPSANKPAAAPIASITSEAAKRMNPTEMKANLKAAGLSIQGSKKELLARLLEQIKLRGS